MSKDFYIGWKDEMPGENRNRIRLFIIIILFVVLILAFLAVRFQKPFNNFTFQLGKQTEISGIIYTDPFPMLLALEGLLPDSVSNKILLIGYGKFGADGILKTLADKNGTLDNRKVLLKGTLIYGDGKTLLELTDKAESLLNIEDDIPKTGSVWQPVYSGSEILQGEIVDPKCYFGVMKPGEGKVHKSCAIRCISGGIPPVLRHVTGNESTPYEYFLLTGMNDTKINKDILHYVGENVMVEAVVSDFNNWKIAKIDPLKITMALN